MSVFRRRMMMITRDSRSIPPTLRDGIFQVYNYSQLMWVKSLPTLVDRKVSLQRDIVANNDYANYANWESAAPKNVGSASGVSYFDGRGHTIYGYYVIGCFCTNAGFGAIIKNLRFKNCVFMSNSANPVACPIRNSGSAFNVCSESCLMKSTNQNDWYGASGLFENPTYAGEAKIKNIYTINCTLKGSVAYGHGGILNGKTERNTCNIYNAYGSVSSSTFDYVTGGCDALVAFNRVYKNTSPSWASAGSYTTTSCANKTNESMKTQAFCDLLNAGSVADPDFLCSDWHWQNEMFPYLFDWTQT